MKKLFISVAIALLAMLVFASPILAWGGSAEAEVNCSDISVTDDTPSVGSTIYFSGTVEITAEASCRGLGSGAAASSKAWYIIYDPSGGVVAQGCQEVSDWDVGLLCADADASQVYCWSTGVVMTIPGDWLAQHGGCAEAAFLTLIPFKYGEASASSSAERTVTAHISSMAGMAAHPVLVVELPDGRACYFASDGWGAPTTKDIVFSDGTWQIEVADGTLIQLDGNWHEKTWLIVDGQGNVTGEYGNGQTAAEDIGLSSPIKITKIS